MPKKRINLIGGAPCSGKSAYSKLAMSMTPSLSLYSTGDALKGLKDAELQKDIANGELVSDNIVISLVTERMNSIKEEEELLFDSLPRTTAQFHWLRKWVAKNNFEPHFFLIEADEKLLWRLLDVRIEKSINAGKEPRAEDNLQSFSNRLIDYKQKTIPAWIEAERHYQDCFHRIKANKGLKDPAQKEYFTRVWKSSY
ncbi:MAG: nucleoside monophosphate kinase [Lactobacillus sp.]|jgi:adenylate kinase|nr:nucleoside monophosphate kinase [Lactobacillus sp.]